MTDVASLSDEELRLQLAQALKLARDDRQENQILYYQPVSETAKGIFESDARVLGIGGGNRSSKTDSCLALITMCATGMFPDNMKHLIPKRFRGPIRVRVICDSLTTTLYPTILPKLQWWQWSGADRPGGERGHWGWIPPYCLKERSWEKAWSEKLRILTLICRDPNDPNVILGESIIHFMSYDQEEGRGTDFHIILHDEPPPLHIWRESEARVMGVAGRLLVAMTWPDDPSIPVDWIFDEVYEPGISGLRKDIQWINLYSTDNKNVDQVAIAAQAANWSEEMRKVRIMGQPIRFSNRVHPLFTDATQHWCHTCKKSTLTNENPESKGFYDKYLCIYCNGSTVSEYNHVAEFDTSESWPTVFLLDPHPRKPHRGIWIQIDPSDDYWQVDEIDCEGDPTDLKLACDEIEARHNLRVALRLIDPNMGRSPSSSRRGVTWQDDFEAAGLRCELADDSETGRKHVNQYMKPDDHRLQPRIHIHSRCRLTISDFKRYVWDDFKRSSEKEIKQVPKGKHDDSPALWKYHMNYLPTFNGLRGMNQGFSRLGKRKGAY